MKAAFIGGAFHGMASELHSVIACLEIPNNFPTLRMSTSGACYGFDHSTSNEVYRLEAYHTVKKSTQPVLLIFTHEPTRITNYRDTMLRVKALNLIVQLCGVDVGLNHWLDAEQEIRLYCDADLQRGLFAARVPYECAIKEHIGRQTTDRLARRLPKTFDN